MSKKKSNAKTTKTNNTPAKRATSTKRSRGARSDNQVETNDDAETLGTAPETTETVPPETTETVAAETTETVAPETAESGETMELAEADEDAATDDDAEDAEDTERTDAPAARTRPALPKIGTVIKKLDRYGKVRCQCTVVEDGIRYKGKLYKSISGAAMAAAKDLNLQNKTQNGFTFWGIVKPSRTLADPVAALGKSWQRYQAIVTAALKTGTAENRKQIRAALKQQGRAFQGLLAAAEGTAV